jgi:hypothetical protein
VLKQRLRDHIDPGRDLGHSDKGGKKVQTTNEESNEQVAVKNQTTGDGNGNGTGIVCEDCK